MPRQCDLCGKKVQVGNQYTYRGIAKYKGGVGRRITGKTKRKFRPNLQRVRALVGKTVQRVRVCTRCIKGGKVRKPPVRRAFEPTSQPAAQPVAAAET